jgi:hypothetical protein
VLLGLLVLLGLGRRVLPMMLLELLGLPVLLSHSLEP